jgi:predicted PurR-regulated permease PerM
MFNREGRSFLKGEMKQPILIGIILILAGAVVALLVLLNFYFTDKLSQIQNLTIQNNQRIGQIENFLNTLDQQLKAQSQQKLQEDLSGNKK